MCSLLNLPNKTNDFGGNGEGSNPFARSIFKSAVTTSNPFDYDGLVRAARLPKIPKTASKTANSPKEFVTNRPT